MKVIIIVYLFAFTSFAGIGDIAGGQSERRIPYHSGKILGDKIHFQKDSAWVSAAYSRSLCVNGPSFQAVVLTCAKYEGHGDERKCVRKEHKRIFQPIISKRQRCQEYEDDECIGYEVVDYIQNPVKELKFYDNDENYKFSKKIIIPYCL